MKRIDRITAIVLLVFSVLVMFESSKMPLQVEFAPGYGFFPFWLGALMALLSVILYVQAWLRPAESDTPQPFPGRQALTAVVTMLVLLVLYAFALEIVGYLVATVATVFAMLVFIEKEPWKAAAVFSVGFTAILYIIFRVALGIPVPTSLLGF